MHGNKPGSLSMNRYTAIPKPEGQPGYVSSHWRDAEAVDLDADEQGDESVEQYLNNEGDDEE